MKVALLYWRLLDYEGTSVTVGGVQTYLVALGRLCRKMEWEPALFQAANRAFERQHGDLTVIGVPGLSSSDKRFRAHLFEAATQWVGADAHIIVFAYPGLVVPTRHRQCVAIHHGVAWDFFVPFEHCPGLNPLGARMLWRAFLKYRLTCRELRTFEMCPNWVCVDYNTLNWYRAVAAGPLNTSVWVIPNFASIAPPEQVAARPAATDHVKVLFARRFFFYRGTRIFAEAIGGILERHPHVTVTFAGEGPDELWLRERFQGQPNVSFMRYDPAQAMGVCLAHDVVVVPSLGSEGTSLSVAEGMGSGCAVIATNVGGITNMIIDGYNGLLVMPTAADLEDALERIVKEPTLRRELGMRAYETARQAFSLEAWEAKWRQVLARVAC